MPSRDSRTKTISRLIDKPSLEIGDKVFPADHIQSARISFQISQFEESRSATVTLAHSTDTRWNYHSEAKLHECGEVILTGTCTEAKPDDQGNMQISLHGPFWKLERTRLGSIETFGMSRKESVYWMLKLSSPDRNPVFSGLELDTTARPFLFSIPIKGLPKFSKGLILAGDTGITSRENDNVFNSILEGAESIREEEAWTQDCPRIFGTVIAGDPVEAEDLATEKAKSLIGIFNFGLTTGMSHFETRYRSEPLTYSAEDSFTPISLHPWIAISEVAEPKGWVRNTLPATLEPDQDSETSLQRIEFFLSKFFNAGQPGDIFDQTGQRRFPDREEKLLTRTKRALYWLNLANEGGDVRDRFTAIWTSLEAILNSINYPGVFEGERATAKREIRKGIKQIPLPDKTHNLLSITTDMLLNRVLQNDWSLNRKLPIFANAFGITLWKGDIELVRDLARVRGTAFHEGDNDPDISHEQVAQLKHLVERLIAGTSVGGYEDLEDRPHKFEIGQIGPEGGGAPLSIDGKDVAYEAHMFRDAEGEQVVEWIAEGKIYTEGDIYFEGR